MDQDATRWRLPTEVTGGRCGKWCRQETKCSPALDMVSEDGTHCGRCKWETVDWLDSQSELLLGMSILEGLKQRGSSLIQSSKHLEKSCTHPVQAQYHAQRIQRSGNHADASGECTHAQTNRIDVKTAAKATKDVSMPKNKAKLPDSLVGVKTRHIGEVDGSGSHADASTIRTDM